MGFHTTRAWRAWPAQYLEVWKGFIDLRLPNRFNQQLKLLQEGIAVHLPLLPDAKHALNTRLDLLSPDQRNTWFGSVSQSVVHMGFL